MHFVTDSTLIGLHFHKARQHRVRQRISLVMFLALVVVSVYSLCIYLTGDGGEAPDVSYRVVLPAHNLVGAPPAGTGHPLRLSFPIGFVGKVRIGPLNLLPSRPTLSESFGEPPPAPGAISFDSCFGVDCYDLVGHSDFGLPDPSPLWTYTSRRLPSGFNRQRVSVPKVGRQAHAILATPIFPDDIWFFGDTAVVDGWLTMHSYGQMTFDLMSEVPPNLGFASAVKEAVRRGKCIPATDSLNNRITVRCRYRCLFVRDGRPDVSVGKAVTASVQRAKHN